MDNTAKTALNFLKLYLVAMALLLAAVAWRYQNAQKQLGGKDEQSYASAQQAEDAAYEPSAQSRQKPSGASDALAGSAKAETEQTESGAAQPKEGGEDKKEETTVTAPEAVSGEALELNVGEKRILSSLAATPSDDAKADGYFRRILSGDSRRDYDAIYYAIAERKEKKLITKNEEQVEKLHQFVTYDHPELFDAYGITIHKQLLNDKIKWIKVSGEYSMTEKERDESREKIDAYVRDFLASMPAGLDEYGKTKYVYDYLIDHTEYVEGSDNNQNICSVFLNHKSVCLGYAKATEYLLRELNILSTIICGSVSGGNHGWNVVCVDGQWYHLDTTWGDANYLNNEGERIAADGLEEPPCYDTFLVTDELVKKNHEIWDGEYYPDCTSSAANYFRRENRFFTYYDRARLEELTAEVSGKGLKKFSIMCADRAAFAEMKQRLIEEQELFEMFPGQMTKMRYSQNEDFLTLTFWMKKE